MSESKSILLDDTYAAFLIAATMKLLTKIFVTDPPSMPSVTSLPINYLLTKPLATHLHLQVSKDLMPQYTASTGELVLRHVF